MERHQYRECGSKDRFDYDHDALRMAKQHYITRGVVLQCYACPYCGGFHLTKQGV